MLVNDWAVLHRCHKPACPRGGGARGGWAEETWGLVQRVHGVSKRGVELPGGGTGRERGETRGECRVLRVVTPTDAHVGCSKPNPTVTFMATYLSLLALSDAVPVTTSVTAFFKSLLRFAIVSPAMICAHRHTSIWACHTRKM